MHGCLSSDSTACNTKLIFLIFSWKKYPISCYVLNEAFTRINSPLFKWQFSCCYPKKWRILQTCFTRFLVDKLRQFREFHTWKIITSLKHKIKKCIYIKIYIYIYIYIYIVSYILFSYLRRFSIWAVKYYFSSVTASWRCRLTFT